MLIKTEQLFWEILFIKLSMKVEIILLRKYNVIFNVKDAGVNRKRKPLPSSSSSSSSSLF